MNKRTVTLLLVACFAIAPAMAQLSVEADPGIGFTLNELSGADNINRLAVPLMVTTLYELPLEVEMGDMGTTTFAAGLSAGWSRIYSGDFTVLGTKFDFNYFTIPILLVGEAQWKQFFGRIGLGVHAWTFNLDPGDLGDDNGIDFASTFAVGYVLPLGDSLEFKPAIQAYTFGYEAESGDESANVLGVTLGLNYAF